MPTGQGDDKRQKIDRDKDNGYEHCFLLSANIGNSRKINTFCVGHAHSIAPVLANMRKHHAAVLVDLGGTRFCGEPARGDSALHFRLLCAEANEGRLRLVDAAFEWLRLIAHTAATSRWQKRHTDAIFGISEMQ